MSAIITSFLLKALNGIVYGSIEKAYENRQYLKLFLLSKFKHRNSRIRLSISGLYRIQVDGKFLLVRGNRIQHQYQPVGGVFKTFPQAKSTLNDLGVESDNSSFGYDDTIKDDLRITIQGKNVTKFLKWYNKQKERELSPNREFIEELIETHILMDTGFRKFSEQFIKQRIEPLRFSEHFQCYEILIAEIYELKPTENQEQELRATMKIENDKFKWVTEDMIRRLGHDVSTSQTQFKIAETARWLLNN